MRKWSTEWHNEEDLISNYKTRWSKQHGIYQIRIVDTKGRAIPIPRIGGTDKKEGVIYIGRSGHRSAETNRSLGCRVYEFYKEQNYHSGSKTYNKARPTLRKLKGFGGHQLQFRVMECKDGTQISRIKHMEKEALKEYFNTYCELPPYNSAFPGKWE